MSQPSFPENPNINRDDAINQILSSIAMEELGLSHIINAEGEKIQYVLGTLPGLTGPPATIDDLLKTNESVQGLLQSASYNQLFLKAKMQQALSSSEMQGPTGPTGPSGLAGDPGGPTGPQGPTGPLPLGKQEYRDWNLPYKTPKNRSIFLLFPFPLKKRFKRSIMF